MTDHQLPRRHSATWIEPPTVPDDETVARLRQVLGSLPNVSRAYLVGQRIAPHDGTPAYDTVGVALVLDRPLTREPRDEAVAEVKKMTAKLVECGFGREDRQSWLFVTQTTIDAHHEFATPIYP